MTRPDPHTAPAGAAADPASGQPPVLRSLLGGFFMGLANLVPGISGGTMILALGLYDRFIGAVADVTRLRFRASTLRFLALVATGLVLAIVGLSGVAVALVAEHRWAMYALFIGMTLGGVPELARASRPVGPIVLVCVATGFGLMALFAWRMTGTQLPATLPVFLGVGAVGAMSMILPGISGSYVLLILGMYDLVVGSLSASALREAPGESLRVVVPVVVGAGLGIALLSNALKALLARFPAPAHAALLGLLVGSVLGLWPFQEAVHPELSDRPTRKAIEAVVLDGADVEAARAARELAPEVDLEAFAAKWSGRTKGELKSASLELRRFEPEAPRVAAVLGLLAVGFALTRLLSRGSGARAGSAAREPVAR